MLTLKKPEQIFHCMLCLVLNVHDVVPCLRWLCEPLWFQDYLEKADNFTNLGKLEIYDFRKYILVCHTD